MRNAFMGAILLLFSCGLTCSQPPKNTEEITMLVQPQAVVEEVNIKEETTKTINITATPLETPEHIPIHVMAREIEEVWEMFFDDDNAPVSDPRREMFAPLAMEVARAIDYWKKHEVDIGGRLPDHRSTHIIIAIVITHESSVDPYIIGRTWRKEVSMFQIWGKALNGYSKEEVRKDTALAAMLGVRWIAHSTSQCNNNRDSWDDKKWRGSDWLHPLTMYGSGPKRTYKDKKRRICKIFSFARRRVAEISMYQERIDNKGLL